MQRLFQYPRAELPSAHSREDFRGIIQGKTKLLLSVCQSRERLGHTAAKSFAAAESELRGTAAQGIRQTRMLPRKISLYRRWGAVKGNKITAGCSCPVAKNLAASWMRMRGECLSGSCHVLGGCALIVLPRKISLYGDGGKRMVPAVIADVHLGGDGAPRAVVGDAASAPQRKKVATPATATLDRKT